MHDVKLRVAFVELALDSLRRVCMHIASPGTSSVEQSTNLSEEKFAVHLEKLAK